jgi:CRP-like cAMP-binding protein
MFRPLGAPALPGNGLQEIQQNRRHAMELSEVMGILNGSEFFRELDRAHLEKVATLCQMRAFRPGETVFRQGDFDENLYIVADGQVSLERLVDLRARQGSVMVAMLGKGRVFGCWSTLLDEPRHLMSSAACQKPTRLLVLRGTDLRKMMQENRALGFTILEKLCFLLRDRIEGAYGAMEKI